MPMNRGQQISDEIRTKRDEERKIVFEKVEEFYVKQLMTLEEAVAAVREQGCSVATWRLCRWLKERGVIRTNVETVTARREAGIIENTCTIPGCTRKKSGCRKYCNTCIPDHTAHRAWLYYGVNQPQVDALLTRQGGVCAGCKRVMVRGQKGSNQCHTMCIDHDHVTKKVRGLLCLSCNRALGYAQDREDVLKSLATYITASREHDMPA